MKRTNILGIMLAIVVMFMANQVYADYTLDLKNDSGTVVKTYTITANQVAHIQKAADANGVTLLTHFEDAIKKLIRNSTALNKSIWSQANEAYIEEQSRQ